MSKAPLIYQPDERIFTLSDVKELFKKQKKRLAKAALITAFFLMSLSLLRQPNYLAEATFKEGAEKSGKEISLKEILSGGGLASSEPQAIVLMKSYQVLKPLIHHLGLQASVPHQKSLVSKVAARIFNNLKAEAGKTLEDVDGFVFQDLYYEGEKNLSFFFQFSDSDQFTVFASDKKTHLAEGKIGSEIRLENLRFTVVKAPTLLKTGIFYPLKISYWQDVAKSLRSKLNIVAHKSNKSIYDLKFSDRDRHFAPKILNQLMLEYQAYLKSDHDLLANEQLAYLEHKQQLLYGRLENVFEAYVAHLSAHLEKTGFFAVEDQAQSLSAPHQEIFMTLYSIESDLALLEEVERQGGILAFTEEKDISVSAKEIWREIQQLRQQRDLIEVSAQKWGEKLSFEEQIAARSKELKEIREEREFLGGLFDALNRSGSAIFPGETASLSLLCESSFKDSGSNLISWVQRVQSSGKIHEKEDLAGYLENSIRLLSIREKMLQERFFHGGEKTEFDGISLQTAHKLFIEYNGKLDAAENSAHLYRELKERVVESDFELGSLSGILTDPLSAKLIASANETALQLKNEKYRSEKEEGRGKEEMALQRTILAGHLGQLLRVEEINASLIREKMRALQKTSLDCINQQISSYYEQAKDSFTEKKEALLQKKAVLQMKMQDIQKLASNLPERWKLEKWLDIKTKMNTKLMETFTELVESKTIAHHLHHVESKPLDLAIVPKAPVPPKIFWMGILGALGGALGSFFFILIGTLLKGFPSSFEKLQAMGFPILGKISSFCDGPLPEAATGPDLDVLRKISLFLKDEGAGKVVSLISGKGPDYSYALAEHLSRMSDKSIVLRCDFPPRSRQEETPGILQVWKREILDLPVRKGKGFDYVASGGFTPFGAEAVQSKELAQIIDALKKSYDWIFIYVKAPLDSAESQTPLKLSDRAIVTVCGEPTEQLTPFADWAYHENRCRLTFLAAKIE